MNLHLNYKSLDRLYKEIDIIEPTGNAVRQKTRDSLRDASFIGIKTDAETINNAKYKYPFELPKNNNTHQLDYGCSIKTKTYSEYDGYDMNVERLHDGLPYLHNIIKKHGNSVGKFVKVIVNVAENCNITAEQMLVKANTAMTILDILEDQKKRVEIILADYTTLPGRINGENVDEMYITTVVKKFEDHLNKQLIATSLSPWMFRYHLLSLYDAKIQTIPGYGHAQPIPEKWKDPEIIYIDSLECLDNESSIDFIQEVTKIRN